MLVVSLRRWSWRAEVPGVASQTNWVSGLENDLCQEGAHGTEAAALRNLPPAHTRREKTAIADRPNLALAHGMVSGMEGLSALVVGSGEAARDLMWEWHWQAPRCRY